MSLQKRNKLKTKTINWCNNLLKNGIMNEDQFNSCVSSFPDNSRPEIPQQLAETENSDIAYNYSLYDRDTMSDKIISYANLNGEPIKCLITIPDSGQCLATNKDGKLYLISNSLDITANESEAEWTLIPQAESQFAILSTYDKYLTIDVDKTINASGTEVGPFSQWNTITTDSQVYFESAEYPDTYLGFTIDSTYSDRSVISIASKNEQSTWVLNQLSSTSDDGNNNPVKEYDTNNYNIKKQSVIADIRVNLLKIAGYQYKIRLLNELKTTIKRQVNSIADEIGNKLVTDATRYKDIVTLRNSMLKNYNNSRSKGSSAPPNLPPIEGVAISDNSILQVKNNITSARDKYIREIDEIIGDYDIEINAIKTNLVKSAETYDKFKTELKDKVQTINTNVMNTEVIIGRQVENINKVDNEFNKLNSDKNKAEKIKVISEQNTDFVEQVYTSNYRYNLLYKALIIILLPVIIYLIYLGYKKYNDVFADKTGGKTNAIITNINSSK